MAEEQVCILYALMLYGMLSMMHRDALTFHCLRPIGVLGSACWIQMFSFSFSSSTKIVKRADVYI